MFLPKREYQNLTPPRLTGTNRQRPGLDQALATAGTHVTYTPVPDHFTLLPADTADVVRRLDRFLA